MDCLHVLYWDLTKKGAGSKNKGTCFTEADVTSSATNPNWGSQFDTEGLKKRQRP